MKISVKEVKLTVLRARDYATIQQFLNLKFAFRPKKLPAFRETGFRSDKSVDILLFGFSLSLVEKDSPFSRNVSKIRRMRPVFGFWEAQIPNLRCLLRKLKNWN